MKIQASVPKIFFGTLIFLLLCGHSAFADGEIIVGFGDSITYGYGGYPYPRYLRTTFGGCATVHNAGYSGERTSGGVSRIKSVLAKYPGTNYVLIMEGANDAIWSESSSTVAYNLGVMVDKTIAAGAVPIIATITPNSRYTGVNSTLVYNYNPKIRALATNRGITLVDMYQKTVADWASLNIDGLHPNEAGAIIIANSFYEALPVCKDDGGGGGGCFIATAAFGSALESHVMLLKQFRDQILLHNAPGRAFVQAYYKYSPPFADLIARHDALRSVVRLSLYPLLGFSYCLLHPACGILVSLLLLAFAVMTLALLRYRRTIDG